MSPETKPEQVRPNVLVVEDEAPIRTALGEVLRDAGMHVIEAANADEAWAYILSGAPVDLIFSDIKMPGSMNGTELARRVGLLLPHIHIILSSGTGRTWNASRRGRFLPKPYRYERALELVLELLGRDALGEP